MAARGDVTRRSSPSRRRVTVTSDGREDRRDDERTKSFQLCPLRLLASPTTTSQSFAMNPPSTCSPRSLAITLGRLRGARTRKSLAPCSPACRRPGARHCGIGACLPSILSSCSMARARRPSFKSTAYCPTRCGHRPLGGGRRPSAASGGARAPDRRVALRLAAGPGGPNAGAPQLFSAGPRAGASCAALSIASSAAVSYTHLTLPTTPYV